MDTEILMGIFVAPFAGEKETNVGGIKSTGLASIVKSSTANPSSAPDALKSVQRIKNTVPFGIDKFLIV